MARYLVIENEAKFSQLIVESIKSINATPEIVQFDSHQTMEKEFEKLDAEAKAKFYNFEFVIITFGSTPQKDWKSVLDGIKSKLPPEGIICLTAYENKTVTISFLKQLPIYNVIYKPFDPLILKETIHLSSQKGKVAKPFEMKSQSSSTEIEILKDLEFHALSELGFFTISDSQVPENHLAKFLSPVFETPKKQAVWGRCLLSAPHPSKQGSFINKFHFYYTSKEFLTQVRKYVQAHKAQATSSAAWSLEAPAHPTYIKLALIGPDKPEIQTFKKDLESYFTNVAVDFFNSESTSAWPKKSEHGHILNVSEVSFDNIKGFFNEDSKFYAFYPTEPKDKSIMEIAVNYTDAFCWPYDRSYFYKKLKVHIPGVKPKEPYYLASVSCQEILKESNLIKVVEASELTVDFNYSRELDVKTFREFLIQSKSDDSGIEVPGFCQYKGKAQNLVRGDPNVYFYQFIFYAVTDHFLKQIRLWLVQNYINQNKKG